MKHYAVIGGGIIGSAIGLALAKRKAGQVTILEKESSLGMHASGRNSGVIHSGINQKPGSVKAKMCVQGSRMLRAYCRQKGVPMNECGTLVVARNEREVGTLKQLFSMGRECGVPGLEIISAAELKEKEPAARGVAALFSPTGATVDSLLLLAAVAEEARSVGVAYRFNCEVLDAKDGRLLLSRGTLEADHVINCAGLQADRVAHRMGVGSRYRIIPFRGEYFEVKDCKIRSMIYRAPDLRFPFLSIHLTRETSGRVLAGPSAVLSFGRESYHKEWQWRDLADMFSSPQFLRLVTHPAFLRLALQNAGTSLSKRAFLREVQSLAEDVKPDQLLPWRSGIRAQMVDEKGNMVDDILVEYGKNATHVLNAVSPGLTCSLAFAEYVASKIE